MKFRSSIVVRMLEKLADDNGKIGGSSAAAEPFSIELLLGNPTKYRRRHKTNIRVQVKKAHGNRHRLERRTLPRQTSKPYYAKNSCIRSSKTRRENENIYYDYCVVWRPASYCFHGQNRKVIHSIHILQINLTWTMAGKLLVVAAAASVEHVLIHSTNFRMCSLRVRNA